MTPRACCKFESIPATSWTSATVPTNYKNETCFTNPSVENSNYKVGCYDKIQAVVVQYSAVVIGVAVGIGLALVIFIYLRHFRIISRP